MDAAAPSEAKETRRINAEHKEILNLRRWFTLSAFPASISYISSI